MLNLGGPSALWNFNVVSSHWCSQWFQNGVRPPPNSEGKAFDILFVSCCSTCRIPPQVIEQSLFLFWEKTFFAICRSTTRPALTMSYCSNFGIRQIHLDIGKLLDTGKLVPIARTYVHFNRAVFTKATADHFFPVHKRKVGEWFFYNFIEVYDKSRKGFHLSKTTNCFYWSRAWRTYVYITWINVVKVFHHVFVCQCMQRFFEQRDMWSQHREKLFFCI